MKKITFILSTLTLTATLLTGCFEPVFYNVEHDVPPETATVSGNILSITRFTVDNKELLILSANGGLRYKLAETGNDRNKDYTTVSTLTSDNTTKKGSSWKTFDSDSLPFELTHYESDQENQKFEGQSIIKTAADTDTLYMITCEYLGDSIDTGTAYPDAYHIWANNNFSLDENNKLSTSDSDWIDISDSADIIADDIFVTLYDEENEYHYTDFNIFCTNAIQKDHRAAFFRKGYVSKENDSDELNTYYKLSSSGMEKITISNSTKDADSDSVYVPEAGNYVFATDMTLDMDSVAYLNGKYYFFDSMAAVTNETADTAATYIYTGWSDGKLQSSYEHSHVETDDLHYFFTNSDGKNEFIHIADVGEPISCIAATKDSLLIGCANYTLDSTTSGGVRRVLLTNGIPATETTSFESNMSIQLSGSYFIYTLLAVDPSKTEADGTLYSSIGFKTSGSSTSVSYNSIGLWAYYSDRGNWNRE